MSAVERRRDCAHVLMQRAEDRRHVTRDVEASNLLVASAEPIISLSLVMVLVKEAHWDWSSI